MYIKMKKRIPFILFIMLTAIVFTACSKEKPYSIEQGAYGFEKATITNLVTKETSEKFFDDRTKDSRTS